MKAKNNKQSFLEAAINPSFESRFPLWFHWLLRITIQIILGALTWWLWITYHRFWSVTFGVIFVWMILVLFLGEKIRNAVKEVMYRA